MLFSYNPLTMQVISTTNIAQILIIIESMLGIFMPISFVRLIRTDEKKAWILFSHGLDKKMYVMGKTILTAVITSFYIVFSALILFLIGYLRGFITPLLNLSLTIVISLFILGITAVLSTMIAFNLIVSQIDLEGHGVEPKFSHIILIMIVSLVSVLAPISVLLTLVLKGFTYIFITLSVGIVIGLIIVNYMLYSKLAA